jgi:riboflavin biosynthesis pyrimidine reductase
MARPRVVTFNLVSVDGRLTMAPGVNLMAGDERWKELTKGIGDPYVWARQVHSPELLLEGCGSFTAPEHADLIPATDDAPEGEHFLPEALMVPGRRWFAIVDGHGAVDLQFTEWPDPAWAGWHALVITSYAAPADHLARLRDRGIPYLVVGAEHVHLPRALELLHDRLGVRTVVCTGGGRLGGALLRQGLVDEVDLEVLPTVIGGRGTPMLFDTEPLAAGEWPLRLELEYAESLSHDRIRLRYVVRR